MIQADTDDEGEVVWLGEHSVSVYEADGEPMFQTELGERDSTGPACAGDFDGDGAVELAWTQAGTLGMFELDGIERWSVPVTDVVLTTPCSAFDADGDGGLDVLYADAASFRILRGNDGAVLYEDDTHRSRTGNELPVVADLDHDGHAEILLVGSTEGWGVVRALSDTGAGFPAAGPGWGAWDFAVTNGNPAGRVPRSPEPSWLAFNTWRGRPATEGAPEPDLAPAVLACGDASRVRVVVDNVGPGGVTTPFSVVVSEGGIELLRHTFSALAAGTRLDGLTVEVTGGALEVRVDAGASVDECDETNNTFVSPR